MPTRLRAELQILALRLRFVGAAVILLVTVLAVSQLVEQFINRVLRPDLNGWTWISEGFLVVALLVTTALWARLRLARTTIAGLERERLVAQTELAVAANVQRALLPPIPESMDGITWDAVMEPAGQVGGDYYDFFPLGNGRMCVVLADVSGKGVPAAVFMSNTRAVLRAVAREHATPGRTLAAVSEMLLQDGQGHLYVTCVVAMVDTTRHTIAYANAGHPAGVILGRGHSMRPLVIGGPPLGMLPAARYDEEVIALEAGDLVVLVSDGITEAIDAGGDQIAVAIGAELASLHSKTPALACATLLAAAHRARGPRGVTGWVDDRTVVAFAFCQDSAAS